MVKFQKLRKYLEKIFREQEEEILELSAIKLPVKPEIKPRSSKDITHKLKQGTIHRLERELISAVHEGDTTIRTWKEYESTYQVIHGVEYLQHKREIRQYTETTKLQRPVPKVYETPQREDAQPQLSIKQEPLKEHKAQPSHLVARNSDIS